MPVPTVITDLSTTAASNSPAGSDAPGPDGDNYFRAHAAFIAQLYAGKTSVAAGMLKSDGSAIAVGVAGTDYLAPAAIGVTVQGYDADIPTVAGTAAEITTGTETALRSWAPDILNTAIDSIIASSVNPITDTTAIATTSGTAQGWTGIPSWVKRITVGFVGVSTNGTSVPIIQIGDSGGYESTGYVGAATTLSNGNTVSVVESSAGFLLRGSWSATIPINGKVTLENLDGNIWVISGSINNPGVTSSSFPSGTKELSATLDRVQLTMANGTDAFDAGLITMKYE